MTLGDLLKRPPNTPLWLACVRRIKAIEVAQRRRDRFIPCTHVDLGEEG